MNKLSRSKPRTADIRRVLRGKAGSALPPFLLGETAFVKAAASVTWPCVLLIVEDEYLPPPRYVEETAEFAFGASAVGALIQDKAIPALRPAMISDLQGFPSSRVGARDGSAVGFARLVDHAKTQLRRIQVDLLLQAVGGYVENSGGGGRTGLGGALLLRLAPLQEGCHAKLGSYVESGSIVAAVGVDTSQPDLGDEFLYQHVSELFRPELSPGDQFVCTSDVQVTRVLRVKERTGIFWRYASRHPAGSGYEIGSCYARVDASFPPIRLDIMATPGKLPERASAIVGYLSAMPRIPFNNRDLTEMFGGNVAVPEFALASVRSLLEARRRSPVTEFYRTRGVDVS